MRRKSKGFTLIELMIVVAILAVLVAIALPQFLKFSAKTARSEGVLIIDGFQKAELAYFSSEDAYAAAQGAPAIPHRLGFDIPTPTKYYDLNTATSHYPDGAGAGHESGFNLILFGQLDSDFQVDLLCYFVGNATNWASPPCLDPGLPEKTINVVLSDI